MSRILDTIVFPKGESEETASKLLIIVAINAAFLIVAGLVLWLTGHGGPAWQFAKGYGLLWLLLLVLSPILSLLQRTLRLNMYDNGNAFVASNLLVSGVLVLGWSSFAALTVQGAGATVGCLVIVRDWIIGQLHWRTSRRRNFQRHDLSIGKPRAGSAQLHCIYNLACAGEQTVWLVLQSFLSTKNS